MEVQDFRAIADAAHAGGALVGCDNTWATPLFFKPLDHGADFVMEALTKYVGGHSDVMLGGIVTNDPAAHETVRTCALMLGQFASPDDCWLALRGARTMAVRMRRQMESALTVAAWLQERPEVARVLYPALPGAPGHDLWKRDFTGAASLFGVEFRPGITAPALDAMVDALDLFGIGASWGGYESLAMPTEVTRSAGPWRFAGLLLRLHIGLEDPADLIADLERGMALLHI